MTPQASPELTAIVRIQRFIESNSLDLATQEDEVEYLAYRAWQTEMDMLHKRLQDKADKAIKGYQITDKRSFRDSIVTRVPSERR